MIIVFVNVISLIFLSSLNVSAYAKPTEIKSAVYEAKSPQLLEKSLEETVKATKAANSVIHKTEVLFNDPIEDGEDFRTAMTRNYRPSFGYRKQQGERRRIYEAPSRNQQQRPQIYYPYGYPSYGYPYYRPIKKKPVVHKKDDYPVIP